MKNFIVGFGLAAVLVTAGFLAYNNWMANGTHNGVEQAPTRYHCPMHPAYISDRPGDCPICGMKLVPMEQPKAEPSPADSVKGEDSVISYEEYRAIPVPRVS